MKLILLTILISCMSSDTAFYSKVTSNYDRYSYFLSINLSSSEYKGRVIIENDDFFYFLNQAYGISKNTYETTVISYIKNKKVLDIGNEHLAEWNFIKVPDILIINNNASKGSNEFIKQYFDGKVIKDGISSEERSVIINILFAWHIPSKIDDETGYLVISN